jgi:predicted  nucleic acid-binding Zn-ribbon protein
MTSQDTDSPGDVIPYATETKNGGPEADLLDRAGNAILGLVNRAAGTVQADLQEAREAAERLADQLRAANERINKLEAKARYFQGRAERAEKWLQQISSEIEQKFLGADDSRPARRRATPQNETNNPASLSFMRRRQDH